MAQSKKTQDSAVYIVLTVLVLFFAALYYVLITVAQHKPYDQDDLVRVRSLRRHVPWYTSMKTMLFGKQRSD